MKLEDLATDEKLEVTGVWKPNQGAEFRIASGRNDRYTRALRRRFDSLPASDRKKPKKTDPLLIETMAEHIFLGFRGDVTDQGEQIEDTKENRMRLLGFATFREWVAEQAMDISNFQQEGNEEEISDLKSRSDVAS